MLSSQEGQRVGSSEEPRRQETLKKIATSKDEDEKDWNFPELDQVLGEITAKHTGIGGILAAMVY